MTNCKILKSCIKNNLYAFAILLLTTHYGFTQSILQPNDMKYDLLVLKATWESTHSGLYRYNNKEEIDSYFKTIDSRTNQPISLRQFFIIISQLNVKIQCGHTFVSYYNNNEIIKEELYSKTFLPVMFRVIDGKFVLTNNLTDNYNLQTGSEITAINNIPVQTIIDSLLTVSKADGKNGLNKKLSNINIYKRDISAKHYCLFDIYFPLFFKKNINDENFSITLKKGSKIITVETKGLGKEERETAYITKYGQVPKNEESWSLKEIDRRTMLFRIGDFTTYNWKFDYKKYLDSVFVFMNQKKYENLIIDIRENEGGDDEARDAVLSYITSKDIGCANPVRRLYRYISIPDTLKSNLKTWDSDFKNDKTGFRLTSDGFYEKENQDLNCNKIIPNPNYFKGKVFLITDVTNSSTSFIMADCVKRNKLAIIVGEKTGGTQQGINGGEIFFFYMPKSKMEMDIPLIWQRPLNDRPDEGIMPDYPIQTTMKDIAEKNDPQLKYILKKLIK